MNPTISVKVDLCNPGQVFACCGLLELAHRMTRPKRDAIGCFESIEKNNTRFLIEAFDSSDKAITLHSVIGELRTCEITEGKINDKEGPLWFGKPFEFQIDWRKAYPQNGLVKTWAGLQEIFAISKILASALPDIVDEDVLNYRASTEKAVTSFDISKSENAQDAGFSLDKLKSYESKAAVVTELLALIGLQRFCPARNENRLKRVYYIWEEPLTANLASAAVFQSLSGVSQKAFNFEMFKRDSEGRYKSFSNAISG